jgi:excinuclease ABC subunit C
MKAAAKSQNFEEAGRVRNQLFALEHINDTALIKYDFMSSSHELTTSFRIEAYDIAHMSGKNMVGVMTVLVNGTTDKNEYRKFIIRSQTGSNDTGALEEVLSRRLRHNEWGMPDLIVIDGGVGQLNVAKQVLFRYQMKIPVVSVVKDDSHKAREILGDKENAERYPKEILLANSEAHRFAITFHKLKRSKNFLPK